MNILEREKQILEALEKDKNITVNKLVKMLYASPATIRRDLKKMENKGLIKRTHGGAIPLSSSNEEHSSIVRSEANKREKKEICSACIDFIKNNNSIFLDASSTVTYLVPHLNELQYLTLITNGLNTASQIGQKTKFKVFVPSGFVNSQSNSIVGESASHSLNKLKCDLFIFSCAGLSIENGICEPSIEQAEIKSLMLKNSSVRILLADSSKFDVVYIARTCELNDVDIIITDKKPADKFVEFFQNSGIKLIITSDN